MRVEPTSLDGVLLITPEVFEDDRGFFMEVFHRKAMDQAGIEATFVQDNHSRSRGGVLRGLHYQLERPQAKLIRVVVGKIFDVAVDLRRGSPTFGRWTGAVLSAENRMQQWVPVGFAHGFYVIDESAEVVYKVSDYHDPASERTLLWNDPTVGVVWPLADGDGPILSAKDAAGVRLADADTFA